eukprot:9477639-Pyramimonas_sp.AAC.1
MYPDLRHEELPRSGGGPRRGTTAQMSSCRASGEAPNAKADLGGRRRRRNALGWPHGALRSRHANLETEWWNRRRR